MENKVTHYEMLFEKSQQNLAESVQKWIEFKRVLRKTHWENKLSQDTLSLLEDSPKELIMTNRRWAHKAAFFELKLKYYKLKVRDKILKKTIF